MIQNSNNISICKHVCERFIERFNQNLIAIANEEQRIESARNSLRGLVHQSTYISDDKNGVLLYNKDCDAMLIVRNRVLVTIYQKGEKIKNREKKNSRETIFMIQKRWYIRTIFSNEATYDLPLEEVHRHYARHIIKQTQIMDIEPAIKMAAKHFEENSDDLMEYVSNAIGWDDIVLDLICIRKAPFINRNLEWREAKKELIER